MNDYYSKHRAQPYGSRFSDLPFLYMNDYYSKHRAQPYGSRLSECTLQCKPEEVAGWDRHSRVDAWEQAALPLQCYPYSAWRVLGMTIPIQGWPVGSRSTNLPFVYIYTWNSWMTGISHACLAFHLYTWKTAVDIGATVWSFKARCMTAAVKAF